MYSPTLNALSRDDDLVAMAVELLRRPAALSELSVEEAQVLVGCMRLIHCAEGSLLMREGDTENSDHMLLILEGEVSIENAVASRSDPLVATVLGPGSLVGEMGLLDGAPRAASCVALSTIIAAGLSRRALRGLITEQPELAAKFVIAVAQRISERLRESGRQQRVFSQLVRAMQGEIEELNRQLQCVMEGANRRQP